MVVHSKIDEFMTLVMNCLSIEVEKFTLSRWFQAKIEESKSGKETIKINGITQDGSPYSIFK